MDKIRIGKFEFNSRLFIGTGKYPSMDLMKEALDASGAEVVTVAIRRVNFDNKEEIKIIAGSINHIRTKMHEIIKAKRYREDKIRELEDKVKHSALKHPSP